MNRHRVLIFFASVIVISCSLFLSGCQFLSANSNGGGAVSLSSTTLIFGSVAVGGSTSLQDTFSNGTSAPVTVSSIKVSDAAYQITGVTLPLVVNAGQNVQLSVQFQPSAVGTDSATVSLNDSGGQTLAALTTTGDGVNAGQLSLNPASVSFGNTKVGGNQTTSVTLSNSGGTDLTISGATLSGAGFSASTLALPLTLHPGGTATLTITFAPPSAGSYSGSVTFTTSAAQSAAKRNGRAVRAAAKDSSTVLPLSGTGVVASTLSANPSSLSFGNVTVGSTSSLPETLTNTGGSALTITLANLSGTGFSISGLSLPLTLNPSQATTFTVSFAPTKSGSASGSISIVSDASDSPLAVTLSGTGVTPGNLVPNPASLAFGSVQVGSSASLSETLTNSGSSSVTISASSVSGTGFSLSGLSLPLTLGPGLSTSFTVKFAPSVPGSASGSITITSNGSNPSLNIPLSGNGVTPGDLVPNPSSLAFGSVQDGNSASLSETLTNSGGSSVTISAASVSGSGFSINGLSLPLTLNAGQSTTFTAKFAPTAPGAVSGSVTITSNGSNPSLSIPLTGTGVAPGALSPSPASLSFGTVTVGGSTTLSETLTNSGGSSVTISAASASGSGFNLSGLSLPLTLNAGQSTTFSVQFAPPAAGSASGSITITSNGSNPTLSIPLSGTGVAPGSLSANPTSLSFGNVQAGSTANLSETLTNTGGSSVTITKATVSGSSFSISGLTLPTTLNPTQSVTFTATFAPTAAGAASGTLTITSNASNSPLSIALSGTGTASGSLSVTPTSLSFGSIAVGSSTSLSGSLNATGAAVTVSSASSNSSEFVLSGITFPTTIPAGKTAAFTVTFAPSASGAASGTLTFTSNAANSPTTQTLSGTGTGPQHSVDLSWDPSTGAVGYNVYRGSVSGGPYAIINSSLDSVTSYTDSTVTSGQTYYYVATAVDANQNESGYSNESQAVIPNP